jgi:hypothetical protein
MQEHEKWYVCPYCKTFVETASYRYHRNGCGLSPEETPETFDDLKERLKHLGGIQTFESLPKVYDPETGDHIQ